MSGQSEFRLGVVGVVEGGKLMCAGCGFERPLGPSPCHVCGTVRGLHTGREYPAGKLERYSWVFDQDIANPAAKFVLAALVHCDMPQGKGVYPSVARLAHMTGMSRRNVQYSLKWLVAAGWIDREARGRRGGGRSTNWYSVHQAETRPESNSANFAPLIVQGLHPEGGRGKGNLQG